MEEKKMLQRKCFDDIWPQIKKENLASAKTSFFRGNDEKENPLYSVPKFIYKLLAKTKEKIFFSKLTKNWTNWENCYLAEFSGVPKNLYGIFVKWLDRYLKTISHEAEIVELSPWTKQGLKEFKMENHTFSVKRFYLEVFLPNLHDTEPEERNEIMKHLLKTCNDKDVLNFLQTIPCIPSIDATLRMISNLVDTNSDLKSLYYEEEGVFPAKDFLDYHEKLVILGMKQKFSEEIMHDRIKFVNDGQKTEKLFKTSRSLLLRCYQLWKEKKVSFMMLQNYSFIPTKCEDISAPSEVWSDEVEDFVSFSNKKIVDTSSIKKSSYICDSSFLVQLGLRTNIVVVDIINQLKGISKHVKHSESLNVFKYIIDKNLDKLANIYDGEDITEMTDLELVFEGKKFIKFGQITLCGEDKPAEPYFHVETSFSRKNWRSILLKLGSKEKVSVRA